MNTDLMQFPVIETDEVSIRAELDRILADKRFSSAPQMSAFLRYIVEETLAGHSERIKAFSIGVDALGKPDTFDAQSDPSVRVLALRLRKTLVAMYEDMSFCKTIIVLRVGTYVPTFLKAISTTSLPEITAEDVSLISLAAPVARQSVSEPVVETILGEQTSDVNKIRYDVTLSSYNCRLNQR